MNFGQMQTALQRYGFDTTDPLATWINAAMHEFESSFDWPFLEEGPTLINVPSGQNFIPLPNDALKVISIRDTTNLYELKYWGRRRFQRSIQDQTDVGLPEVYTLINTTQIQVWRVPTQPIVFEVIYQALAPDMVNPGDVPTAAGNVWPSMCHYPIVMRAASVALQAENEEERAKTAQEEYMRGLMTCMGKFGERELDQPETVEDAQGYGSDMPVRGFGSTW